MATLELNELACERKQDVVGRDEPEIWIDGAQVWTGSLGKGDSAVFSPPITREFTSSSSASPATFSASGYRDKLHYRVV